MPSEQRVTSSLQADAVVLGAGMSGLVAVKILQQTGYNNILVIDEYDRIGGNHISKNIGPYTFDIGTIIFQDDSPLMRHFPELLEAYHPIEWSISRITPDNSIRDYPISMKEEVYGGSPWVLARIIGSLLKNRARSRVFDSADSYARYWIGSELFERSGLAHYFERFYGMPATKIDPVFAEKRMDWIAQAASVSNRLRQLWRRKDKGRTGESAGNANRSFARPRSGFAELYAIAQTSLERDGATFALGQSLASVRRHGDSFTVTTGSMDVTTPRIVSTIPLDRAGQLCGATGGEQLPYSRLITLFFSFAGDRGFASTILYNFSLRGAWKRITMFSEFFGRSDGREYFGVEVVATEYGAPTAEEAAAAFQADVQRQGIFKGELAFEGAHVLDHAYPVYVHGAIAQADQMMAALKALGVETMGRQGAFDYLPTARQVTLAVEKAMGFPEATESPAPQPVAPHAAPQLAATGRN